MKLEQFDFDNFIHIGSKIDDKIYEIPQDDFIWFNVQKQQILDNQKDALELQELRKTGLLFSDREWVQDQIKQLKEKAEKWKKLIESFTFDFEPVDGVEEVARQFIDNEIRTSHKLYEENKRLKKIELGLKKRVIQLTQEDDEDLKRIRKNFPNWSDEEVQKFHNTENYCKIIIDELHKIINPKEEHES